jgi:hypothetical protein
MTTSPPETEQRAAEFDRRTIRAEIRAENHIRPRCARCTGDLFSQQREWLQPLTEADCEAYYFMFDPGDLLCFWCWCEINPDDRRAYIHGYA